ncbi:MAG TPA: PrgI family protein [Anaerolineae bacterium]|nr:PrgI family protein [Anaerolineae bacterium]
MIRFPRRIDKSLRPAYGLSVRQLAFLSLFGLAGGMVVLLGEGIKVPLPARLAAALGLVSIGGALAFVKIQGLTVERWLFLKFAFLIGARRRVWQKRGARKLEVPPTPPPRPAPQAPRVSIAAAPAGEELSTIMVAIELVGIAGLVAFTLYLWKGGLTEIQAWLRLLLGGR